MKRIFRDVVFSVVLSGFSASCIAANTQIIYGFDRASDLKTQSHGEYYIQAGGFLSKYKADHYKALLQSRTNYPVNIIHNANLNIVRVGPIHTSAEVRKVGKEMQPAEKFASVETARHQATYYQSVQHSHYIYPEEQQYAPSTAVSNRSRSNWFVALGAGMEWPQFTSSMRVNNGSGFPAPYDMDVYSTSHRSQPVLGVAVGNRWERDNTWLSAFSLGLSYQNILATNLGNTVTQYSTPEFTNYNYSLNFTSNVVLIFGKINLFRYRLFSPYVKAGLGCAFDRLSNYNETALPGVTARISPAFASQNTAQFAYNAGAGFDFEFGQQMLFSIGYEYLNLGKINTGSGSGPWTGQSLNLGRVQTNQVFLGMSYLIGK